MSENQDREMKEAIVEYVKVSYNQVGAVPSLRDITKQFKPNGLNLTKFYRLFPGGLGATCKLASVPIPTERIVRMRRIDVPKSRSETANTVAPLPYRITLTADQTKRLLGLSHLEHGKSPLVLLDKLLDDDATSRKNGLTLDKRLVLANFIETALARGWTGNQLVDFVTQLFNTGLMLCAAETVVALIDLGKEMQVRKWAAADFVESLTRLHNVGILNYSPAIIRDLIRLIELIAAANWSSDEFVKYVTQYYTQITAYYRYMRGEISFEAFRRSVEGNI